MTKLSNLFSENYSTYWNETRSNIINSIDTVIEKGNSNEDILLLMKDLLKDVRICTSMSDYIDEVNDGQ